MDWVEQMRERLEMAESVTLPRALALKLLDRLEAAEKVIEAASSDVFWDTVAHPKIVHKGFLEARAAWQQVKEEHDANSN